MEAIKLIENVTSDSITIRNLSKYKGKKVEIILFPIEEDDTQESYKTRKDKFLSTAGSWNDINTEALKEQIYKNRESDSRESVDL